MSKTYALYKTKKIEELVSQNSEGLCLDAGCGRGVYFDAYKGEVVGIDLTRTFLQDIRSRNRKNIILGDIKYLPFKNKVFSFLLCTSVIEHLHENETLSAIKELERVTKGMIQLDTPNAGSFVGVIRTLMYLRNLRSRKQLSSSSKAEEDSDPLLHHSCWTPKKLGALGFEIYGCLGWVTRKRIKNQFLCDAYDLLVWRMPWFAGTIIGIKRETTYHHQNAGT